jgi:hypothetical protein
MLAPSLLPRVRALSRITKEEQARKHRGNTCEEAPRNHGDLCIVSVHSREPVLLQHRTNWHIRRRTGSDHNR